MQDPTEKHVSDVGILDKYNYYYYYYDTTLFQPDLAKKAAHLKVKAIRPKYTELIKQNSNKLDTS
jgi:hypothetical protein